MKSVPKDVEYGRGDDTEKKVTQEHDVSLQYVKVDQRSHVLQRPSVYIGSVVVDTLNTWVLVDELIEGVTASVAASSDAAASVAASNVVASVAEGSDASANVAAASVAEGSDASANVAAASVAEGDDAAASVDDEDVVPDDEATSSTSKGNGTGTATVKTMAPRMIRRELRVVPGLVKVFDEVLVNAFDHGVRLVRLAETSTASNTVQLVRNIRVCASRETGVIEVYNDGNGIDVVPHTASLESGIWVPELIFGHLLTSTNYDDDITNAIGGTKGGKGMKGSTVGGQNGIGAKACNIFSVWFEVETLDTRRHLLYRQRWTDNMAMVGAPVIERCTRKKAFTRVRFLPDYARFGLAPDRIDADTFALLRRRTHDACAVTDPNVSISFNDAPLNRYCKSFRHYVDMFVSPTAVVAYERLNVGTGLTWEIAATTNPAGGGLCHMAFVNGVWTPRGGRHVDHIVSAIVRQVVAMVKERRKVDVEAHHVRNNLFVFVRATIPDPRFDSQTKETLTTPPGAFGGTVEVDKRMGEKLVKEGVLVERLLGLSAATGHRACAKTDGRAISCTVRVPKLEDAHWAGSATKRQRMLTTLILTEGNSAASTALSGISAVPDGRNLYGVFPLRGKLLNVRDLSAQRIADNAEITALKMILGLQSGREYTCTSQLRYGHVMLLADADFDGSHIKGLFINLLDQLWPSLLRLPGFLTSMMTPVVKAFPPRSLSGGDMKKRVVVVVPTVKRKKVGGPKKGGTYAAATSASASNELSFYTVKEYERWRQTVQEDGPGLCGWSVKYYKGLGTSTPAEAKTYFRRPHTAVYVMRPVAPTAVSMSEDAAAIALAFDKRSADARKVWLGSYDQEATLPYDADANGVTTVCYADFVHLELSHFAVYDVARSIPSAVDGLKPSQRKILWAAFKRNLVTEIRVAQLAGYVSENAAYHHGEASLLGAIIGIAQNFVGSNNVNLLLPRGQFGTRREGGKDAASARYIHTLLSPAALAMFPVADQLAGVLAYTQDDGVDVEPEHYLPVLPLILINGANGIGTGFSTSVPCYDPRDISSAVRALIVHHRDGGCIDTLFTKRLVPWYRGFTGTIHSVDADGADAQDRDIDKDMDIRWVSRGRWQRVGPTEVRVTELPVGTWTLDFKEQLDALVDKYPADLKCARNEAVDVDGEDGDLDQGDDAVASDRIDFAVHFTSPAAADMWLSPTTRGRCRLDVEAKLMGSKGLSVRNMHMFDASGHIRIYADTTAIILEHFRARLGGYERRKLYRITQLQDIAALASDRARFVRIVIADADGGGTETLGLATLSTARLGASLTALGFARRGEDTGLGISCFKHLLDMSMRSMTPERIASLEADVLATQASVDALMATTPCDLWLADLDILDPLLSACV